jgi:hypothetical protein
VNIRADSMRSKFTPNRIDWVRLIIDVTIYMTDEPEIPVTKLESDNLRYLTLKTTGFSIDCDFSIEEMKLSKPN